MFNKNTKRSCATITKNYLYACMPVWIFKENLCEEEKILIIDLFCISEFLIISIVLRITLIKAHYYWAFLTSFWWNVHGRSGQRLRLMGSWGIYFFKGPEQVIYGISNGVLRVDWVRSQGRKIEQNSHESFGAWLHLILQWMGLDLGTKGEWERSL